MRAFFLFCKGILSAGRKQKGSAHRAGWWILVKILNRLLFGTSGMGVLIISNLNLLSEKLIN